MSQYPSPYVPPTNIPYYGMPMGMPDLLAPAKRASVLMFVLGGLGLLMGGCVACVPLLLNAAPGAQADQLREQTTQNLHMSVDVVFPVIGLLMVLASLTMIVLGIFVRRGGRGATLGSCIFIAMLGAYWLLNVAGTFLQAPGPQMIASVCFGVVVLGLLGLLFMWLIAAFKAAGNLALAKQQYAAQYWQYQQNMQAYGYAQQQQQQPLGYPTAPTLPPPPPQNPA